MISTRKNPRTSSQRSPARRRVTRRARTPLPRSPLVGDALRRGLAEIARRFAKAVRMRSPERPSKFLARAMRLDRQIEATSRYRIKTRPWYRGILEAIADPEVRSIAIPAATQVGKTLALIAMLLWIAEHAPAPAMVVVPDKEAAIELRDRVYLNALATIAAGHTERLKVPPEYQWNTRHIDLGSMRVYLAWSGSRQRLRGRPCKYVFMSEVDVYKGDKKAGNPISAGHQRTKAFFRYLHYHESSPSEWPSEITELEQAAASRYRWHVPCPHCGQKQELRFFVHARGKNAGRGGIGGLKNSAGDFHSAEEARSQAHYICEAGCRIDGQDKQRMLESGEWVLLGERTGDGGRGTGAGKSEGGSQKSEVGSRKSEGENSDLRSLTSDTPSRRSLGFHLWSIHAESLTFGDLAASYIEARESGKLAEWWGNWLGISFRPETKIPTWQELGRRLAWTHGRRTVPAEAWFLTAGIDVQGENKGIRYVIRAWGPAGTSWLIDWGWIERNQGDENDAVKSDLATATKLILDARFPVVDSEGRTGKAVNPLGRRELSVRLTGCDSNYLPRKVHDWLRSLPDEWVYSESPRVRALRGDHQVKPETRYRMHVVESNSRTGEKYDGGLLQWGVHVYTFYDDLRERLAGEPGKPGSWYVTADCLALGKSYLQQVTNFGQFVRIDEKTGAKKVEWGPRNGRTQIDYWDCEIYARVMAEMVVGDLGWSEAAWEAWRQGRGGRGQGTGDGGQGAKQVARVPQGMRDESDWDAR